MAEFIMKHKVKELNIENKFYITSKATSEEELGNDIHPGTQRKLIENNIPYTRHYASKVQVDDYNNFDYFICDDCEREWADHIGISADKITFFVEKYNDSQRSASAFQDAVGQALKNLGYLTPTDASLNEKIEGWANNHTTSSIPRLRKHPEDKNVNDAINLWKKNRMNPLCQKEMCLVVNFISLNEFTQNLNRINDLNNIVLKTTTLQRLWFLSSFVNACSEVGVTPKIYCAQ